MKSPLLFRIPFFFICFNLLAEEAVVPTGTINLLADPSFEDFTFHLSPKRSLTSTLEETWLMTEENLLHVPGTGWGYLRTNTKYRDYHLVMEYKWGERTSGYRAVKARDNGLLVHAFGKDGAYSDFWMNSIEAQLIEGGSGDILVLADTDAEGVKAPTRLTAEVRDSVDGHNIWTANGETHTFPAPDKRSARIYWRDRDPDWKDVTGFRGAKDVENPLGEWNRFEVICEGDRIRILLNGEKVNEGWNAYPSEGFICLQTEGAEIWIRRYELWPLDRFTEKWIPSENSERKNPN